MQVDEEQEIVVLWCMIFHYIRVLEIFLDCLSQQQEMLGTNTLIIDMDFPLITTKIHHVEVD